MGELGPQPSWSVRGSMTTLNMEPRTQASCRARMNRDLQMLRSYISAGVACQRDLEDAAPEAADTFLRSFSSGIATVSHL